ncbi:PAS domain S-box protein [Geminocystis sp. NIES-3709]|uniref:PAS domain S-box protein n=1 Tax=Geminocystis sp. NIES-3709 TaxID=1617448 RepID=UPI0005FCA37F|nr:PAS domain S-box protein [Geminocystis sp. NIES-3709]BAQ65677.1 circadian input kinase A [Geminocystis sp. NIES-3709]
MVFHEELNLSIIDYHPILILPDTSFEDVVKKMAMGYEYLIVVDDLVPLGVISPQTILKIVASNINVYSLRAKKFCETFPCYQEKELPNLFTITQNIYKKKYIIYGCVNNRGNLNGIISDKSICSYFNTESFYHSISISEVIEPNLTLVKSNLSLASAIHKLNVNKHLKGFIFEENCSLKIVTYSTIISSILTHDWKGETLGQLETKELPYREDHEKITLISSLLEQNPNLLINHYFPDSVINSCLINNYSSDYQDNDNNCYFKIYNRLSIITSNSLIKVLTPPWQQEYLRQQQRELNRIKTAFKVEKKQVEQEKLLSQLSQRIRKSLHLEEILKSTVNEVRHFLACDRVIVYQLYPDGDGVIIAESVIEGVASILGRVVQDHCFAKDFIKPYLNGRIQAVDNVFEANLSPCHLDLLLGIEIQANLVVPIIFHDGLWGLLAAQNCLQPRHWLEDELELLQKLASQVAIAIQQSEYAQKALQVAQYQTAIATLGNTALISNNLDTLINTTVKIVSETLKVEYCDLLQLQPNRASFVLKAGIGWAKEWIGLAQIGSSPRWMPGYTLKVLHPVITEDLLVETRFSPSPILHNSGIISGATVHIASQQGCFGVMGIYSQNPRKFSSEDINFLQTVANVLATAIDRTQSQRQLDYFFNLSLDMFCIAGVDGSFKQVNTSFLTTLGYNASEMVNKNILSFVHPDDVEITKQELEKLSNGFPSVNFENRWLTNDGQYRWLAWKSLPYDEGIIYAVARDITLAKQAESQLRSLNEELETRVKDRTEELEQTTTQLRTFVQTAGTILLVLNQEYRIVEWNEEAEKVFGWRRDSVLGEDYFLLFIPPHEREFFKEKLNLTLKKGQVYRNLENKILTADGNERTILWNVNRFTDNHGRGIGIIACGQDIEEVRLAQLRLKLSEQRFRSIFHQAAVGILQVSLPGKLVLVNDKFSQLVGYNRDNLVDMDFHSLIHSDDVSPTLTDLSSLLGGNNATFEREIRLRCANGKFLWINLTMSVVWVSVDPSYFIAVINDISDRKKAEESLQKSEGRLNSVLSSLQDVVWSMSLPDLNLRYINPACQILYGYSPVDILVNRGILLEMVVPEYRQLVEDTWQEIMEDYHLGVLQNEYGKNWELEYKIQLSTGDTRWIRERSHIVYDEYGRAISIDGISTDVTERHLAEEKLFKSLQEKEILLKEVHHRVKNNLYVISGLLNLQSSYIEDEKLKSLFEDSQNRIQSMAVIHELLYQSDDLSEINFAEYINRLVSNLFLSYNHYHTGIKPITHLQECYLNIETAIPAGLLINELVTNAFKHAFPQREGEVTINLTTKDKEPIKLEVIDNGIGLPSNLDWEKNNSLGLRLVRLLSQQLDAEITVNANNQGTCFIISFTP